MHALYGVNVFGGFDERLVDILLERLAVEPWSHYRALQLGGPEWYGYSGDSERLASLNDRTTLLTKVAAQRKGRLRDSEVMPRPKVEKPATIVSSRDEKGVAAVLAALNS